MPQKCVALHDSFQHSRRAIPILNSGALDHKVHQQSDRVGACVARWADGPQTSEIVTGWGLIDGNKSTVDLMETDIDIVSNAICNKGAVEQTTRDFGTFRIGIGKSNVSVRSDWC